MSHVQQRPALHHVADDCPGGHIDDQLCICGHLSEDHHDPCDARDERGEPTCWAPCLVQSCDCEAWFGRMGVYVAEMTEYVWERFYADEFPR